MKIMLDPGHNASGADTGACGNGLREQDISFGIAEALKPLLEAAGHTVRLTRPTRDTNLGKTVNESLANRAKMANDWGAELFISVHCNAGTAAAHGTEVYAYARGTQAASYAQRVQSAIVKRLQTADRGVKYNGYYVLKHTSCPAILVETAFITNASDSALLRDKQAVFAAAICEGVAGQTAAKTAPQAAAEPSVMRLDNVYVQEIFPDDFGIYPCDCAKQNTGIAKYFNLGYFAAQKDGSTVPVGNLAADGKIVAQAADNAGWMNLSSHKLTTIYTTTDGKAAICQTDRLSTIDGLRCAVSGIPIIRGGVRVTMDEIKQEGYFGSELYDTWHGFLGLRHEKLVYVAAKCGFSQMCWLLVALGIYDAIKLDGGGSFILHDGNTIIQTSENRRIHNVGMWSR